MKTDGGRAGGEVASHRLESRRPVAVGDGFKSCANQRARRLATNPYRVDRDSTPWSGYGVWHRAFAAAALAGSSPTSSAVGAQSESRPQSCRDSSRRGGGRRPPCRRGNDGLLEGRGTGVRI
jgi:hypothetical protein